MKRGVLTAFGTVALLLAGYLIGQVFPINTWVARLAQTAGIEWLKLGGQLLAAFATFTAVVVGLFRDEIRKFWYYPKVTIMPKHFGFVAEVLGPDGRGNQPPPAASAASAPPRAVQAERYEVELLVANEGNVVAKSCELSLERLTYIREPGGEEFDPVAASVIDWTGRAESRVQIPSGSRASAIVISVSPPQQAGPAPAETAGMPTLSVAGIDATRDYKKGTWVATFVVHSENADSCRYSVKIYWNGEWHNRLTEMRRALIVDVEHGGRP